MDYFNLGSKLGYLDLNAIVYLLRKFKRLTSDLTLGSNRIESDYGVYSVTGGLTSVGGNFILEDDVTISSSDVLLNCFYTFHFTVVDVNLSGTVNRRVVSVTGDTGDDGVLEVVLEPSLLESDEVILPDFKVDIVFDEHEYYTPVSSLDITLEVDKSYITVGESNTVTATVLDSTGSPVEDLELQFSFNGDIVSDITDEDGVASVEYTGTGAGWVTVTVSGVSIRFFDGCMVATVTGSSITLGNGYYLWLGTVGNVIVDWGDGTTNTVNNPRALLTHTYNDGLSEHNITFYGEVTSLGYGCFYRCTGLTSIFIPNSVTSLGTNCFNMCTGLTSVTIPEGVTSLGDGCFFYCTGLTSVVIPNSVTSLGSICFSGCSGLTSITIPNSVTSLGDGCFSYCTGLTSVNIPSSVTSLEVVCFYECTGLTSVTIPSSVTSLGWGCFANCTGLISIIIPNNVTNFGKVCFLNCSGLTSVVIPYNVTSIGDDCFTGCTSLIDYELYWTGDSIITYDGGKMLVNTNTIFTVPVGTIDNYISKGYPSNKLVERGTHTYNLSIASDKSSILTTESVTISGTLLMDSNPYTGQSVALYDGSTLIDTLTTDSNGNYSKTLTGLSAGTHTFKAVNTNAESSTVTVTVSEPTPVHNYSITITGDSIIQTGDNDNITATLKDNSVVVSGETLNYQIKHGNTVIDSGTDTTDSNGEISITYTGTGAGDVQVIVSYGSLLQETYGVEDCIRYDTASTDKTSDYTTGSTVTSFTHSTDHYEAVKSVPVSSGENYYSPVYIDDTLPTDFEISVDILISSISNYLQSGLCVSDAHITTYQNINECSVLKNSVNCGLFYRVSGSLTNYSENTNLARDTWYKYSLEVEGTSVTAKIIRISDNTVMYNQTKTLSNIQSWKKWNLLMGYDKQTLSFKNLKIKAL